MTTPTADAGDPTPEASDPSPGSRPQVPGFETGDLLGIGSTGSVWSAVRERDGALVALKVVRGTRPGAADAAARELGVLGRAAAEHVVRVHDAVALADGDVVLVLDLLSGGSLRAAVRARGHLSPGETVTVLSPVAAALGRLHAAGVVHGDVSPGNVLLDRSGRPVLADLGTARLVGEQIDEVRGTEGFVAPEVLAGALPEAPADVYAVGALGWLCLAGSVPGPGPLRGRLVDALTRDGATADDEGGYAALVSLIEACLDPVPEGRPGADELALAVFESAPARPLPLVAGHDDVSALTHRIRAAAARAPVEASPRTRRGRHVARSAPARRVLVAAVAALIVLGGVLVASLVLARRVPAAAAPVPALAPVQGSRTTDPTRDRAAVRTHPAGLLGVLVERRADAWRRGRVSGLAEVDSPGSAALARDTALLAQVQQGGLRYEGLGFVVVSARADTVSAEAAVLRARVDTTAHVITAGGRSTSRPAQRGDTLLVDLVWTDAGWRVADIRAAPDEP